MSKMSREKGKRGEREVASLLRSFGYETSRGQQFHGGPDSPDVVGLPGIHIEVKRTEKFSLYEALEQSKRDSGKDETPIVIHRRNGKPWVVCIELCRFMELYSKGERYEKK